MHTLHAPHSHRTREPVETHNTHTQTLAPPSIPTDTTSAAHDLTAQYSALEESYQTKCAHVTSLEKQVRSLNNELRDFRERVRLTEDLERSQNELAMLGELQRMESLNEKRALQTQLEEAERKHGTVVSDMETTQQKRLEDIRVHFEGELNKVLEKNKHVVNALERRVQEERERFRSSQETVRALKRQLSSNREVHITTTTSSGSEQPSGDTGASNEGDVGAVCGGGTPDGAGISATLPHGDAQLDSVVATPNGR